MTTESRSGTALLVLIALAAGIGLGIAISNLLRNDEISEGVSAETSHNGNSSFSAMIPLADGKAVVLADGPLNTYWYYLVDSDGKAKTIYPYGGDQSPLAISR